MEPMNQQSHLWFLNNINLQNVFPPIINDAKVIFNRYKFDCKKKNMTARVICNINVKEEAIRLNVNDDNVIRKVREIVWRSSSPLDKQMCKEVSNAVISLIRDKFPGRE
ncbi:1609_t:CDS:1 [Acaulospora morrowiae]|uniref:1609_t:CDS:1 n=1 Tax=Acaulospora morrowiae TaxID=94023 RepID=A0A9N8VV39_9GLOM|nr:1609_t:CDS:1 [Acaulospora morrowiae]